MTARRGKPIQIEWQESADQLHEQFKQTKDTQVKTRLQAMWLLRSGHMEKETAVICGVSERTMRRWVQWYRAGGIAELRKRVRGQSRGRKSKMTPAQEAELRQEVDTGRFHTAEAIADWVKERWQIEYQPGSIYTVLQRLNIKKKVPRRQSEKADPALQEAWKKGG